MIFETVVTGKWILAGEHSVLRGSPALVFPLWSRNLKLKYWPGTHELTLNLSGAHGDELQLLFWGVLEKACELKKIRRSELHGTVGIESNLPIGAGLGASAALCVGVSRWLSYLKILKPEELYEFSRQLENLFHGESSGVDIAIALSGKALHFERSGARQELALGWQPQAYLSYTGKRGVTKECVEKVKDYIKSNPEKGAAVDLQMRMSVNACEQALRLPEAEGFALLAASIREARQCYKQWGLDGGVCGEHIALLEKHGAVAVKPTGSGDGGYAFSLWKNPPPKEIEPLLIPCFV
jgi:mevalonate kinase